MNFADYKSITIPEGEVTKIAAGGVVLWEKASALPSAYQQVEWVEAAFGVGAYLNLGFSFDTAAIIKLGFYIENVNPTYIFGAAESSGKYRCMISAPYNGAATAFVYGSSGSSYITTAAKLVQNGYNELEYTIKSGLLKARNITNGSTNQVTNNVAFAMTSNLYLFAQNYNGSTRYGDMRKISYFEYYDKNDTLICSLLPCYRKSDGVIGMYDTVRKQFLTNVGSGSFTKGADV